MSEGTIQQTWNDSGAGYCKMPDGTLIQWGDAAIQRKVGINETAVKYFSTSFSSAPKMFTTAKSRAYAPYLKTMPSEVYYDSFRIVLENSGTTDYTDSVVDWIAIGRWK